MESLKVTLKNGSIKFCYGVAAAAKLIGVPTRTLENHLAKGGSYNKNGMIVEETEPFDVCTHTYMRPTIVKLKGPIVNE